MLKLNKIHCLHALQGLKNLDDESVDCVMTSPPYAPHRTEAQKKSLRENSSTWPREAFAPTFRSSSSYKQAVTEKSLCLIPARFQIAMAERGWILRNNVIWHKPNHMPSNVKDQFACSWKCLERHCCDEPVEKVKRRVP